MGTRFSELEKGFPTAVGQQVICQRCGKGVSHLVCGRYVFCSKELQNVWPLPLMAKFLDDFFSQYNSLSVVVAAATPGDETAPAIAKGAGSELLLVYEFVESGKPPVITARVVSLP